ncbi:MAG: hypothetical protein EOM26_08425 [Alphaproteobacteria bacterium]|nr:hypothetical protein [Alphaproteobacteria bacterium]
MNRARLLALGIAFAVLYPGAGFAQDVYFGRDTDFIIGDPLPHGRNWVRLSGRVHSFFGDSLTILAGEERVDIDTDDLDLDAIGDLLEEGDEITVVGELNDDGIGGEIEAWRITAMTEVGQVVIGR